MSDKYTYADVIIDPDDPRVELGKEYYFEIRQKMFWGLLTNKAEAIF